MYPKCVLMAANVDRGCYTDTNVNLWGQYVGCNVKEAPSLLKIFHQLVFHATTHIFFRHTAPSLHYACFCRKHFSTLYFTGSMVDELLGSISLCHIQSTLKLHILKCHAVAWMRQWQWALGLHGKQGAESIHNIFNTLEWTSLVH